MRIAFISTMSSATWGGSEELWSRTAAYALEMGNQVLVSVVKWDSLPEQIEELQRKGAIVVQRDRYYNEGQNSLTRLLSIIRQRVSVKVKKDIRPLLQFNPELIVINQGGSFDLLHFDQISRFLLQGKSPYILLCHSSMFDGTVLSAAQRIKAIELYKKAKNVCFVAQATKQKAEKGITALVKNSVIIKNPVNIPANQEIVAWPLMEHEIRFACIGTLSVYKGYDVLFEVLSESGWKTRDWHLDIFGSGPDEDYLRDLVLFYDLQEKITFKGYSRDIIEIWKFHHMLILPSRLESAPLVIVEAMLCGRPTVATNVGGISEWITDGHDGFLAEALTVRLLDSALQKAWSMRAEWKQMGDIAHSNAKAKVDPNPEQSFYNIFHT